MARLHKIISTASRRLARTDRFALLLIVLLVAKTLLLRNLALGHTFGFGLLGDTFAIVAVVCAAALASDRLRRPALMAVALFVPIGMFVFAAYASFFGELPSVGMLSVSGQLGAMGDATRDVIGWQHALLLVDVPLVLLFLARTRLETPRSTKRVMAAGSAAVAVTIVMAFAAASMPKPLDSLSTSYRLGFFAYSAASSLTSPIVVPASATKDRAELQATIDELTGHDSWPKRRTGSPDRGVAKGKNLIVIQMEALQAGLIGARYRGQPIVPNLEALAGESIHFPNTYSQIGRGNTSDAEFILNTSLYPAIDQPSSVAYARKELPSLPRLLKDSGYRTLTMHTNNVEFWNRQQLYDALGFEEVYDESYFGQEEQTGLGASDRVLYQRAAMLLSAKGEGAPFYAQLITVSAHYPFSEAAEYGHLSLPPEVAATQTGKYLQSQSYADAELGWFIEQLRESGLLDESVVMVYGDHFGLRFENATDIDREVREEVFGHGYNRADFYNVPLLVRVPGEGARREATVVGMVDFMPTIADLLGLDVSDMPLFGKSAFVDSPTLLTRASSIPTYIDTSIVFLGGITAGEDRWYSAVTQEMLPAGNVPTRLENARRLVELSQSYASGLPERPGASDETGHIPKSALRFEKTPYR